MTQTSLACHPWSVSRRTALRAGALGLGLDLGRLRAWSGETASPRKATSCIYIFLSGGLAQHESFDLKPAAPAEIRGEFQPIATSTPGLEISEHLPGLAQRSEQWSLLRSLSHPTNDHTLGHYLMLTGRSVANPGFRGERKAESTDWPSLASTIGAALPARNRTLPPAIVLPERLVHWSGGVIPGAYGGQMGRQRDPFFIEASPYGNPFWRGAYPEYTFPNESKKPPASPDARVYQAPEITLAPGLTSGRLVDRLALLHEIDRQRAQLEQAAVQSRYDDQREAVVSLLADPSVRQAFDVTSADDETQRRYGRNSFGWSLLMAFRLVAAGVNLVQVNLGSNETWDTHGDAFPRLKDKLLPPTDRALCALLDDLRTTGLLDSTLLVMAGEFGRTPKISLLPESYYAAGRDHWGAVQSVWLAGGGVKGGHVTGASDAQGAYPARDPQRPENLAATMYHCLGIDPSAVWHDELNRPHPIYHGEPIRDLLS
jgi:uncharacterized protein (DUF1501 family)